MNPDWLFCLALLSLVLALVSAIVITFDPTAHPQKMAVMHSVWPFIALFRTAGFLDVPSIKVEFFSLHSQFHHPRSEPNGIGIGSGPKHSSLESTAHTISLRGKESSDGF